MESTEIKIATWWNSKRRQYNKFLLITGMLSFLFGIITLDFKEVEITIFTMLVQLIIYLIFMSLFIYFSID